VVKHAFVKSTTHLACQRQKPCLPSTWMELVMLRSEKEGTEVCACGTDHNKQLKQSEVTDGKKNKLKYCDC
jgi:hypothetical protein